MIAITMYYPMYVLMVEGRRGEVNDYKFQPQSLDREFLGGEAMNNALVISLPS
jgi:hypothetical protein